MPDGKVRFAAIYGNCAAMGFTPQQARAMSIWQYMAAMDGFNAANAPPEKGLSKAEEDELAEWLGI